ncbi:MAG: leucine-rich repeat domain-containing protein [Clostridiales bacterium]|nr:leucine-rich repeat domain-containing protein [Clostridiales bacterium]
MKNMKNMEEKKSRKFKILASVLGIVVGVSSIFAPACATKSVDDTYINDNGELIIVYTDGTQKNLGVVKGEDGKDGANGLDGKDGIDGVNGVDGKDLTACTHEYGSWQTEIEATCTSIGYDTRTCALCGDIDYRFNEAGEHNYDMQTAVDVVSTGTEHWVNATCKNCNDTKLIQTHIEHKYDENGVCTECGDITHFIESEEYIEDVYGDGSRIVWWSIDRSYGLVLITSYSASGYMILDYVGTPVDVIIPAGINGIPITNIGGCYGFGSFSFPFSGCETLESIIIPEGVVQIFDRDYNKTFKGCVNLSEIVIKNPEIEISSYTISDTAYWNNYEGEIVYIGDICIGVKNPEECPEKVVIKEGTTHFADGAFGLCLNLKEIDLPNSIIKVDDFTFNGCTALTSITIPRSVVEITPLAFYDCTSLHSLNVYRSTILDFVAFKETFPYLDIIYYD